MNQRYRVALAMGQTRLDEVVKEDEELLKHFGLQLLSIQGCLSAAIDSEVKDGKVHPWNVVEISSKTWGWLRPILSAARETAEEVPHLTLLPVPAAAGQSL